MRMLFIPTLAYYPMFVYKWPSKFKAKQKVPKIIDKLVCGTFSNNQAA